MQPVLRRWFRAVALAAATAVLAATAPFASRFVRAQRLLEHFAEAAPTALVQDGSASHGPTHEQAVTLTTPHGPLRARIYRPPEAGRLPAVVVAPGIHYLGIDEPRLCAFARALAESGVVVLTPELEDLTDYRVTEHAEDEIADAVEYLAARADLVRGQRVGLLGFSFAGSLSLLAATDPAVGDRLAWVASVGGYDDLGRVLRFYVEHRIDTPEGMVELRPHEYGPVVFAFQNIDRLVPEIDRETTRQALRSWLHEDRDTARAIASGLATPEGRRIFAAVTSQNWDALAPDLERVLAERHAEIGALSPHGKLGRIRPPVYLLHGSDDRVIPPSETEWAARELGTHKHLALVSPLIEHVELAHRAGIGEKLALLDFVAALL